MWDWCFVTKLTVATAHLNIGPYCSFDLTFFSSIFDHCPRNDHQNFERRQISPQKKKVTTHRGMLVSQNHGTRRRSFYNNISLLFGERSIVLLHDLSLSYSLWGASWWDWGRMLLFAGCSFKHKMGQSFSRYIQYCQIKKIIIKKHHSRSESWGWKKR